MSVIVRHYCNRHGYWDWHEPPRIARMDIDLRLENIGKHRTCPNCATSKFRQRWPRLYDFLITVFR